MSPRLENEMETLDHKTSRSICDAIGERLQQSIRPEPVLSDHLRHLLEELRRRDYTSHS
jgi:hypothetical protein